jgi:hypothetical protein
MDFHRPRIDVRLKRRVSVWQLRKRWRPDLLSHGTTGKQSGAGSKRSKLNELTAIERI